MKSLLAEIAGHSEFQSIKEHFFQRHQDLLTGLNGTQKSMAIAALTNDLPEPCLIVSYSNGQAYRLYLDLLSLFLEKVVLFFPNNELFPHEEAYEPEVTAQRVSTLGRLLQEKKVIVVTSWEGLQRRLLPPEKFKEFILPLKIGEEHKLTELAAQFFRMGYEMVELVTEPGQCSRRGDILDIFPLDQPEPIRIEFFGDEIDSIRSFKSETQLSIESFKTVLILPAREGLWHQNEFNQARNVIDSALLTQTAKLVELGQFEAAEALSNRINEALERLSQGHQLPGADQFLPWVTPKLVTLFDYLPQVKVILDEPIRGKDAYRNLAEETANILGNFLEKGIILPKEEEIFCDLELLEKKLWQSKPWSISLLAKTPKGLTPQHTLTLPFKTPPNFHGKVEMLCQEVSHLLKDGCAIILVVSRQEKARRLREILREQGIASTLAELKLIELAPRSVWITVADLESGFEWPNSKIVLLTETEIYGRQKKVYQAKFQQEGIKISSFTDLKPGDYVVHINHGIGKYIGLETLEIAGGHRDYLRLEYANGDRLFVPTDQVNLIQKYIGVEDNPPKINKLGGADWQKVKNKVKESVQDMAEGLIELYAKRETLPGYTFGSDTVWQHEFEEAFFYEETADQLRAVQQIKQDLESPKPMDRLLCGDVGYGKTEVAMRAAFKVVMEGKQVGVLVPTTILAQQHFLTFRERFAGFPVNLRVISRFQTNKEQQETIAEALAGEVDILIGTHRLLSSDVHFKDLGLLIIDEEQRFGVAHKEKIKELRHQVDVLTLTATPIPRTLHMSLAGLRDVSLIETPPVGRYPIRTHVLEYNDEVIREAIQRELDRQGQVYFVYNRVETIERMATHLQSLLPNAQIAIAHGQLNEEVLERIMLDFYDNQADILLCTTIIETGLDISNVNTLIVYDADRFGLSQLYQLRGRVGRSNRLAHAYFCYHKEKILSENAEKRLAAIREFTELGSGFKIAMRDLEIRGAGNLLGPEQHGQIATIGFELYCRLLEEAIREKKGEITPTLPEPVIEISIDAYIPTEYIKDAKQKVEFYKKIGTANNAAIVDQLAEEILDRFGTPPPAVENLLNFTKLKALAKEGGFASLTKERGELVGKIHQGLGLNYDCILEIIKKYRNNFRYQPGRPPTLKWKETGTTAEFLKMVIDSIEMLKQPPV